VIPGKEEYAETIRYYNKQIEILGVHLHLNQKVSVQELLDKKYDEVVLATGVTPRKVEIEGADHPKVLDYAEVLYEKKPVGKSVAIIGAGGIGFDMAEFLAHEGQLPSQDIPLYMKEWGVDMEYAKAGSLADAPQPAPSPREIYLLKRSTGKHGKNLGKTTGWIHRSSLAMKQVKMLGEVEYNKIDDQGLHILHNGTSTILKVDHIVVCAGQESLRALQEGLESAGQKVHIIGGAHIAAELDAKKAIKEASYLAASL